jgi:hypothetical protein
MPVFTGHGIHGQHTYLISIIKPGIKTYQDNNIISECALATECMPIQQAISQVQSNSAYDMLRDPRVEESWVRVNALSEQSRANAQGSFRSSRRQSAPQQKSIHPQERPWQEA